MSPAALRLFRIQDCRRILIAIALLLTAIGIAAAQDAPAPIANRWTFFVWMAADNDLEPQAMEDLKEMELGLPEAGVEIIVFVDRHARNDKRFGDWSGGRLYRIRPNRDRETLGSELLREFGVVNSNDPALLAREMAAAFKRFPARQHAAVFWNHGGGWASLALDEQNPDAPGKKTDFTIMQIGTALRDGLAQAGIARLDLVGFDMCLMAQMETAAELHDLARILVASEATEPGTGWSYDAFLPVLASPETTVEQLAKRIVDSFDAANRMAGEQVSTLSAVDLDRFGDVLKRLDEALAALQPELPKLWTTVGLTLFHAEGYASAGRIPDLQGGPNSLASIDILDALRRLRANAPGGEPAAAQLRALEAALANAVIATRSSQRHRASTGLAVYAPIRAANLAKPYAQTRFARESRWPAFLEALHVQAQKNAKAPEVARISLVNAVNGLEQTRAGLGSNSVLRVLLRGEGVLYATATVLRNEVQRGRMLVESVGFLVDTELATERLATAHDAAALMLPQYTPGGAQLSMDAPGIALIVAAGDRLAHATIDASDFSGGVPQPKANALVFVPELGPVLSVIDFDPVTLEAVGITALVPGAGGKVNPRRIQPHRDLQLVFLVQAIYPGSRSEQVPGGDAMLWGDGPRLIFDLAPGGPYQFQIAAESIGGGGGVKIHEVEIIEPDVGLMNFVHAARALAPHDLQGEWLSEDGKPFGSLTPAERPDLLTFVPADPQARELLATNKLRMEVRIDLRRLPMLSLVTRDERDRTITADHGVLYVDPESRDRIRIRTLLGRKGDARGQSLALVRRPVPGAVAPTPPAALGPAAVGGFIDPAQAIGTWRGRLVAGQEVVVAFQSTGTYQQQVLYGPQFQLSIAGQWSVSGRTLVMRPQSWNPTSWCAAPNQCQAITLGERSLPLELRDDNQLMLTPDFMLQRLR